MNQLKTLRKDLKITQEVMALSLGISRRILIKYEKLDNPPKYIIYAVKWLNYYNKHNKV